jgi:chromosome segregation ATPase
MALAPLFGGCSYFMNSAKTPSTSPGPAPAGKKYSREIVELNKTVRQNAKPAETKQAHLELAHLYSDHKNPRRNYQKALEHLKAYAALEDSGTDEQTLNWMATLKEIKRLSEEMAQVQTDLEKLNKEKLALKRTNHKLAREEIKLREKNRELAESNLKLKKTIEMLKNLDRRLEEKRKTFSN